MRRLADDQTGAVAVTVAICLLVLFGMGALVVDVGRLYFERRQLQNGADAAALAVAQDCASGDDEGACDAGPGGDRLATARGFADDNAHDGASAVADGAVDVDYGAGRVTVTTTTPNDGGSVVQGVLGPVLGAPDRGVSAASTAIWGPVAYGSIGTLPLTFSKCEYDRFLATGAGNATEPWTTANNGAPTVIYMHGQAEPCNAGPSGQDLPGGFGWLETTTNSECEALVTANWVGVDPGASPSQGACSPAYLAANVLHHVIYLPVFDDDNGQTGNNAEYHLTTYAAFYVTGYNFGGQYKEPAGGAPCSGNDRCIAGWFTTGVPGGGVIDPGAPDQGVRTVQLTLN